MNYISRVVLLKLKNTFHKILFESFRNKTYENHKVVLIGK